MTDAGIQPGSSLSKNHLRVTAVLACCGSLPLLLKLTYLFSAWRGSALDRLDWIFGVLFLLSGSALAPKIMRLARKYDLAALCGVAGTSAVIAISRSANIHALEILGAILFWWSVVWLVAGWRSACAALPAFGILLCMCPSTTNWISFFFRLTPTGAFTAKCLIAGFCTFWAAINLRFNLFFPRGTFCFCVVVLAAVVLANQSRGLLHRSAPLILNYDMRIGDYLGRDQIVTSGMRKFFKNSRVRQIRYSSPRDSVELLEVQCGGDVHEIHPASHCLRTSGNTILSEYPREVMIRGVDYQVTEIVALRAGVRRLVWVWYSCETFSTGSFLGFRRGWKPRVVWYTYQVSTPFENEPDSAGKRLETFMNSLPEPRPKVMTGNDDEGEGEE